MAKKSTSKDWFTQEYQPLELEKEVLEFWDRNGIQRKLKLARLRDNRGVLGWVEGPPTLNGYQHVGHARGRTIKDLRYRWKSMQGYYIPFRGGWDCQGLPVELEVERELGVRRGKKQLLEQVGEERFVQECKKVIMKYYQHWHEMDRKMGVFIDHDEAYWTYRDEYIEREWQILRRAWEDGLLGEGYRVVAYCPYCQTSLSNAEVGLGYEEVEDPSVYFKLKVREKPNEFLVIWTTMPFTIVTDMLLAAHPDAKYARVRVGDETWIMAADRVEPVMQTLERQGYTVATTTPGKELVGLKYDYPFLDIVPKQREMDQQPLVHTLVSEDFVDVTTATGVVHLSPGNGEDDFFAAQRRNVPIFVPFDDECRFTSEAGEFNGLFARDSDSMVIRELEKRGLLLLAGEVKHEYPTCWRSHHKLIWLARREYFLWTDRINERVVEAAEKVNYFFEAGRNRFLAFLKEAKPWNVSRERVWGAPLPVWACSGCGSKIFISTKAELLSKASNKVEGNFELHKPWIDRLILKCEKCGERMQREPYLLDTWHNSGASPYASFTDEEYRKFVPVDFLVEGIDQTRGWANSLLLEHVVLTGGNAPPYRAFLFYGLVLDERGAKMSKSLGNVVETLDVLKSYPADLYRFYLLWKAAPIEQISFSYREMRERPFQVLSTFYNLNRFFLQNATYDRFDPRRYTLESLAKRQALTAPDYWLLSKLQDVVASVTRRLEGCEFHLALSAIEEFVIDAISRRYVPMTRRRLWSDDPATLDQRMATYATLWHCLKQLTLLLNPAVPFHSEYIYQKVFRALDEGLPESVNLNAWPEPDKALINAQLEQEFELLSRVVTLVNSARQSAGLKRRWPLRAVVVVAPQDKLSMVQRQHLVLLELSNSKSIEYEPTVERISEKVGFVKASLEDTHVFVDTTRDESLVGEGLMRDLARRIQALRKEKGFLPTDVLDKVAVAELDEESQRLIRPYLTDLKDLVRTREVELLDRRGEGALEWRELGLDGRRAYVALEGSLLPSDAKRQR